MKYRKQKKPESLIRAMLDEATHPVRKWRREQMAAIEQPHRQVMEALLQEVREQLAELDRYVSPGLSADRVKEAVIGLIQCPSHLEMIADEGSGKRKVDDGYQRLRQEADKVAGSDSGLYGAAARIANAALARRYEMEEKLEDEIAGVTLINRSRKNYVAVLMAARAGDAPEKHGR